MKRILYLLIFALFVMACHQRNTAGPADPGNADADSATKTYLPVAEYLRGEISYVDSTPLPLVKYTTQGDSRDSGFIRPQEFHQLAQEFLVPELAPEQFEKNFVESSFMDETTKSLTFTYSTTDKTLPLQRVDVLVAPGDNFNRIKSIYLERVYMATDTQVVKKFYWKSRHSFMIISSLRPSHRPPVEQQVLVTWAPEDAE